MGILAREARGQRGGGHFGGVAENGVLGLPLQPGFFYVGGGLATGRGQAPAAAVAAAVIPLVFLLSPLHLPLLHPALVDMEGGEGQHDEAEDEGDQDNQHQRGGEGLEDLLSHLRNAGAAACAGALVTGTAAGVGGSKGPVEETRRQRQPQLLGRPGTHRRWAGRGLAHQTSSLGHTVPTRQEEDGAPATQNCSLVWECMRTGEGLREPLRASKPSGKASGTQDILTGPASNACPSALFLCQGTRLQREQA